MIAIDAIAGQDPTALDSTARNWVLAHQSTLVVTTMSWVSRLGSVTPMALVAVAGALVMWWRGRRRAITPMLLAPVAAVLAYHFVKRFFARTRPNGLGRALEDGTYSFPSAHATTASAVCLTLAYVFWREHLVSGAVALPIAVFVAVLIGVSRIYLDVHWTTDVLGGWSLGLLIAALSAALDHQRRIGGSSVFTRGS